MMFYDSLFNSFNSSKTKAILIQQQATIKTQEQLCQNYSNLCINRKQKVAPNTRLDNISGIIKNITRQCSAYYLIPHTEILDASCCQKYGR